MLSRKILLQKLYLDFCYFIVAMYEYCVCSETLVEGTELVMSMLLPYILYQALLFSLIFYITC